ncbi:MAG: PA0069 family radical SAM protein [Bacteroidia bacterium]
MGESIIKGRGAQFNGKNKFLKHFQVPEKSAEYRAALDEWEVEKTETQFFKEHPKKIVNKVASPDVGAAFSINPYQGCEHGCIYCYARNSHQYWGYSAGLDFESKIIIKESAPELLVKHLENPKWIPASIMLSGNTDCYQPIERKKQLTRKMLEVFLEYRHPVGIITKNSLILRDLDLLKQLAEMDLVHVMVSVTTLDEDIRRKLEPRTASGKNRLRVVEELANNKVPVGVMTAPIIPGLNDSEIPAILREAGARGARSAGYTIVRLNGEIAGLFTDWARKHYPDRADKMLNQIADCHNGKLNDSRFGTRMRGEGHLAGMIKQLFTINKRRYIHSDPPFKYNFSLFRRKRQGQLDLFG